MLSDAMLARLRHLDPARLVVAFSGGLDSTVLLHVACDFDVPVHAIHVNHGLSIEADGWQQHATSVCDALSVPIHCERVEVSSAGSVEENARKARYRVFERFVDTGDVLLLAHHADDQVETALMNLFRGSNRPGVSGMPVERPFGRGHLLRPFIEFRRRELEEYAQSSDLRWVHDESNEDRGMSRNFIRHDVLPLIETRWPGVRKAVLKAIARSDETSQLLDFIGEDDLAAALDERGGASIDVLWDLPVTRRHNLIRVWLAHFGLPLPESAMLDKELDAMHGSRKDAAPLLTWQHVCLRRHDNHLFLTGEMPRQVPQGRFHFEDGARIDLPTGELTADFFKGRGLAAEHLNVVEVRFREGGEKLSSRTLKNLMQESGVPAWLRDFVPLIYLEDELVAAAGLPDWGIPMITAGARTAGEAETGVEFAFRAPKQPYSD